MRIFLISVSLALSLIAVPAPADELALPGMAVTLDTPEQPSLGTLPEGVGLEPGSTVPEFHAQTIEGAIISWSDLRARAPLLVVFYRGGWCPYCNLQIRQLTEAAMEFDQRGVLPVLISADQIDGAALAKRTYDIPFPVLSDSDLGAHRAFNVVFQVDESTREKYLSMGLDLSMWSGRNDGRIAVSSAYIVDATGVVRWAHADYDYARRPSVEQLLGVIDELAPGF